MRVRKVVKIGAVCLAFVFLIFHFWPSGHDEDFIAESVKPLPPTAPKRPFSSLNQPSLPKGGSTVRPMPIVDGSVWTQENLELIRPIIDELESKLVVKKAVRTKEIPVSEAMRKVAKVPKHVLSFKVDEATVVLRKPTDEEISLYARKCAQALTGSFTGDAKIQLSEWLGFSMNYRIVNVSTKESWNGVPPAITWVVYDCNEVTARVGDSGEEVEYYSSEDPAPTEGIRDYDRHERYSSLFHIGE